MEVANAARNADEACDGTDFLAEADRNKLEDGTIPHAERGGGQDVKRANNLHAAQPIRQTPTDRADAAAAKVAGGGGDIGMHGGEATDAAESRRARGFSAAC